jgi:hypothetical protein
VPEAGVPEAPKEATDASTDLRAREVLGEGPPRRVVGQRLAERIGARRWERAPVVCCSERIFERCELADPWDPAASDRPIAVGPVGMRFEERRQPAPHARVKESSKPPSPQQAWTPPKGIPQAAPKPAAAKPAAQRPTAPASAGKPAAAGTPDPADPAASRSLPPVKPPPGGGKPSSGRFRMRSTSSTGPKVRSIPVVAAPPAPEPSETEAPAAAPEPEAAPTAPPPKPAQGLDDLFGSLGQGGRDKRVGRKK